MKAKIFVLILIVLIVSVESLAQGRPTYRPSSDVAQQENASLFLRRKNEPFEGEGDIEYTKSQEEGLIAPVIGWSKNKKSKKWQVPYKIDLKSKFTTEELTNIQNELSSVAKKLNVTFKTLRHETYVITISSLKQCADNLLQRISQPHNEIAICFNGKLQLSTEITRAVTIGLQINKEINNDSSEEDEQEEIERNNQGKDNEEKAEQN